jgi:predicted enzyme related to lactoylglutathione lyase
MSLVQNIGGIFIFANDPDKLREWYRTRLGIDYISNDEYNVRYTEFWYREDSESNKKRYSLFSIMKAKEPLSLERKYMINFRVDNLDYLVAHLKELGEDVKPIEIHPEGKFSWLLDPEENHIELWEDV